MKLFSKKMLQKWSFDDTGVRSASETSQGNKKNSNRENSFLSKKSLLESVVSNQIINPTNFIQIGLASSDEIQNWAERSYFLGQQFVEIGEVKRPDTLNYRTFKPEKDGLFCERIFGPVNDWTCGCGQIKEQRFAMDHERALLGKLKPKICPNCHVEVTSSRLRRYRMGYISLACPVTHIWYLNSRPSLFSILLKMPTKYIKKIAYYKAYSPSSLQREYMSSCLGPGGDFFDNEWEFLHLWLAGKHSIEDIPSRITQFIQSKKNESLQDFQMLNPSKNFSELKYEKSFRTGKNENLSKVKTSQIAELDFTQITSGRLSERKATMEAFPTEILGRDGFDLVENCLGMVSKGNQTRAGFPKSNLDGLVWPSSNPSTQGFGEIENYPGMISKGNQTTAGRLKYLLKNKTEALANTAWPVAPAKSFFIPRNIFSDFKNTPISNTKKLKERSLLKDIFTSVEYLKMPESPEWLANTGAQALMNHLKSRDWQKETEKLELEFQSTSGQISNLEHKNSEFNSDIRLTPTKPQTNLDNETRVLNGRNKRKDFLVDNQFEDEFFSFDIREKLGLTSSNFLKSEETNINEKETDFLLKRRKNRVRTLKLLKSFQKSGLPFSGMIFHALPVLPPELRPIIQLGAGQLASSDVNDLYRRIISRNNRLKYYLYETHFVEFLVRSEQQLVQLAVDALLENGKTTSVRHTSGQKRLYKSLSDRIGGKQGRFRMNLLGKRVDYSGRSVIVVGPRLKLFQCGLPYEMALELFQPFLLRHMLELQLAKTIRAAKNILRFNKPLARQLLHHVVQAHPILLNRAPTLHRLGIQAFQPVLVFGRAIHLHPLVCPAFNADFDGDQMAVHIPLSPQSRIEARLLMLASGNWLSSSTGQPNVLPSQDMVLGFYYLTIEKYGYQKGRGLFFQSLADVMQAYEIGSLDLHSQIWLKWYGPFTGDSNSRLTNPQKHKKIEKFSFAPDGGFKNSQLSESDKNFKKLKDKAFEQLGSAPFESQVWNRKRFQNFMSRFRRDADQPIEIRVNKNGISTKIYSSYQWQQDSQEKQRVCYIRTTPGRVLMNQIFQKFS
jgi:DNA-directed RNA polymerase beta' subunit